MMRLIVSNFGMKTKAPDHSSSDLHAVLYAKNYVQLNSISDHEVSTLKQFYFESIGVQEERYLDQCYQEGLVRTEGMQSDGSKDCPLASIARKSEPADLAAKYFGVDKNELYFGANICCSPRVKAGVEVNPDGYDGSFRWHRDCGAYQFLNCYVYLNDILDEGCGHHEYFSGTIAKWNSPLRVRLLKRYTTEEIHKAYPAAQLIPYFGKAGSFYVENASGFHRGTLATNGYRIQLSITYESRDWAQRYRHHAHKVSV